jgi:hypothetical protein
VKEESMRRSLVIAVTVMMALFIAGVADASDLRFGAELSGDQQRPTPVVTEGEGEAKFETDGSRADFELKWKALSAPAFVAHIHCGDPDSAGPVGVTLFAGLMGPEGEIQGSFLEPDFGNMCGWVTLDDVLAAVATNNAYVNVHSTAFPGGEIRGQLAFD